MPVKISIIIVSYNSEDFIEKCVTSVLENLPEGGEVIVIDNASTDCTVSRVKSLESRVKVVENKINMGFAKANNSAAREANGEYIFFLNPDTEIPKQVRDDNSVFDELINFYEKTPDSGIVAPKLIMENGEVQPSVRKLPTILGAFKEYILGMENEYSQYVPDGNDPVEVEMVYGAVMLIERNLFEKLGEFNEKYFLYYEDADLCKRVRKIGKKIYYYPGISVKHLVGGTKTAEDKYQFNLKSSRIYHGLLGAFILQIIFLISRLRRKL